MHDIIAGIVTYNPNMNRLKSNLDAVKSQVQMIVVADNGSNNIQEVNSLIKNINSAILLNLEKNYGIAFALNRIFEYAEKKNYEYVLTLDQDSVCGPNLVFELKKYAFNGIGIVSPAIWDINRNDNEALSSLYGHSEEIDQCITSGALTSVEAWKDVAGFDEVMFIDGVDFDFCDRIKKYGWRIIQSNSTYLEHEIGHITIRRFLGFPVAIKNHSAFRKYYIAKNIIYLDRKKHSSAYPILSLARILKQVCLVVMYEEYKAEKLRSLLRGMRDGFKERIDMTD